MKFVHLFAAALLLCAALPALAQREVWREDFSGGLARWEVSDTAAIYTKQTDNPEHGWVLVMNPANAKLLALIANSSSWSMYRIEGDVFFPTNEHNYLGFIYNYTERGDRVDLGSIYIKGNGSYIRVNPRRDWNPGRRLYEELRVELEGPDAIQTGQWQRFAAEVDGTTCHFYVGDMKTPKVTFDFFEYGAGKVGFKPRVVGGPVWLDNIRLLSIQELSYSGPPLPAIEYKPDRMVKDWEVLGPYTGAVEAIEMNSASREPVVREGDREYRWRGFSTDPRGAVITAQVTDFVGPQTVAYFRTTIQVGGDETATLEFSSIDDLTIWQNGKFEGYSYGERFAWYDFIENPNHPATPYSALDLVPGENQILIRVRGGKYAAGGFYATVVRKPKDAPSEE